MASVDAIRYFKGGYYSTMATLINQRAPAVGGASVSWNALDACVRREWIMHVGGTTIYSDMWTITDAGRAELARAKGDA